MDFTQYIPIIQKFVTIIFVLFGVDGILKVTSLDRTFGDLFIRIGVIVLAMGLGYGIVMNVL